MDSPDKADDSKTTFRKPTNDIVNRKYRRRSSTCLSPPPGSPERRGYGSQNDPREDSTRMDDDDWHKRKKDTRECDWTSGRNAKGGSSYRYDRASFRDSHGYKRRDDDDRDHSKLSEKVSNDSGDSRYRNSGQMKNENECKRSRDGEKYAHTRYINEDDSHKGKHTERRSSSFLMEKDMHTRKVDPYENSSSRTAWGDSRKGRSSYGNAKASCSDLTEASGCRSTETDAVDYQRLTKDEKKNFDYRETKIARDRDSRGSRVDDEDEFGYSSRRHASPLKAPKLTSTDKRGDFKTSELSRRTTLPSNVNDVDNTKNLDAAKVAALRAAELVNKNLVGVGMTSALSTDQKKKLLWGSKKKAVEESGHSWDASLFPDRDQQEKFNRLMSLRLPWCLWQIVGCEGRGKGGTEGWKSGGKEYPRSRETKGATTRFRETIHCWTEKERWAHSRLRPLIFSLWHHLAGEAWHFRR